MPFLLMLQISASSCHIEGSICHFTLFSAINQTHVLAYFLSFLAYFLSCSVDDDGLYGHFKMHFPLRMPCFSLFYTKPHQFLPKNRGKNLHDGMMKFLLQQQHLAYFWSWTATATTMIICWSFVISHNTRPIRGITLWVIEWEKEKKKR